MSRSSNLADSLVALGAGVTGATWMTELNDALQLVLTACSIVGVIYAIVWHHVRISKEKKEKDRDNES